MGERFTTASVLAELDDLNARIARSMADSLSDEDGRDYRDSINHLAAQLHLITFALRNDRLDDLLNADVKKELLEAAEELLRQPLP